MSPLVVNINIKLLLIAVVRMYSKNAFQKC